MSDHVPDHSGGHDDHGHEHGHDPNLAHHFDTMDQQLESGKLGMWAFLATEILMFGGLFCAYAIYRGNNPDIFLYAHQALDTNLGAINTAVLLASSFTMAWAVLAASQNKRLLSVVLLWLTFAGGIGFMGIKTAEYWAKWDKGLWIGPTNSYYTTSEFPGGEEAARKALKKADEYIQSHGHGEEHDHDHHQGHGLDHGGYEAEGTRSESHHRASDNDADLDPTMVGDGDPRLVGDAQHPDGVEADPRAVNASNTHDSAPAAASAEAGHLKGVNDSAPPPQPSSDAYANAAQQPMVPGRGTASGRDWDLLPPNHANVPPPNNLRSETTSAYLAAQQVADPLTTMLTGPAAAEAKRVSGPKYPGYDNLSEVDQSRLHIFFQIYFLMTGLHGLHVLIGMGLIAWVAVKAAKGAFSPGYFAPVEIVGLYWHLVDLIWIFLFPLLYLIH